MKKIQIILLLTIFSFNAFSQITFENGYFIDNSDKKTECLIKNVDWKDNPKEFSYKLSREGEVKKAGIESVKEFGITDYSRYRRFNVKIDQSSVDINQLSVERSPDFKKKTLFLEVLVEGEATLYGYADGTVKRFFYQTGDQKPKQLIYKEYMVARNKVKKNNRYKQQVWNKLRCSCLSMQEIEALRYKKNNLAEIFISYNKCINAEFKEYSSGKTQIYVNLTLRPSLNVSSLQLMPSRQLKMLPGIYVLEPKTIEFGYEYGFKIGLESEFILPFNKNKWSLLIEPAYQYYKSSKKTETDYITVDYKSIEVPLGLRHYFFLNNQLKFFLNAAYVIDITNNPKIKFRDNNDLTIKSDNNFLTGVGFNYKNKYSLEFRYGFRRDILREYKWWYGKYNSISVNFGYTFISTMP